MTQCYVAEVRLRVETGADVSWVRQSLDAACRRLDVSSPGLQVLSAVHNRGDGRLSCVLRAASLQDVQHLFEIALLPPAQVLEVTEMVSRGG